MTTSSLDGIPGLGEVRRKALLRQFGSVKRLRAADVEEIAAVPGIGRSLASAVVSRLALRRARPGASRERCTTGRSARMTADERAPSRPADSRRGPTCRPDRHRHRDERRRPQHDRQRPRGPRLVRRRQPAAAAAPRISPSSTTRPAPATPRRTIHQVAVVVDVRSRRVFADLADAIERGRDRGERPRVVFLDADRRGARPPVRERPPPAPAAGRRPAARRHPARARAAPRPALRRRRRHRHLRPQRPPAARQASSLFAGDGASQLRIAVMSFGFKYGLPLDADFVFDMRFLPNPYWVPELRALTGRDTAVSEFVMRQPGADEFLSRVGSLLDTVIDGFVREGTPLRHGRRRLHGRQAPSVAIAEELSRAAARRDARRHLRRPPRPGPRVNG